MSLRLRYLRLRAIAGPRTFGVDIPFEDGLVILRADNNSGKSTCIQAIIYALGLEQMLGPKKEVPLPSVMTNILECDGREYSVDQSEVVLEIENHRREKVTIHRQAKGSNDRRLVTVIMGPELTDPEGIYEKEEFYTSDPGSATRDLGFHSFLSRFIGWTLPIVSRFNGTDGPLYLQCIFPLVLVEQKHGWAAIQANTPRFLQIREVEKRSIEFLLDLDAFSIASERQRIAEQEEHLRENWRNVILECDSLARSAGASLAGLQVGSSPHPLDTSPRLVQRQGTEWRDLDEVLKEERTEFSQLQREEIPTAQEVDTSILAELETLRSEVSNGDIQLGSVYQQFESDQAQLASASQRIIAIEEDLRQYQDLQKIKQYGAIADLNVARGECPVCGRDYVDSLMPQRHELHPMSVDENIEFLKEQRYTLQHIRDDCRRVSEARHRQVENLKEELTRKRRRMRYLKDTLTEQSRQPAISAVQRRVELSYSIETKVRVTKEFERSAIRLAELWQLWSELQERKKAVPKGTLSPRDLQKLKALEDSIVSQLRSYGFSSFAPELLSISEETYKPTREGFDIGFDLSASDGVRTIWSYLVGLLEVASKLETNHPGLLIFDEPEQQNMRALSFEQLLARVSLSASRGQQVLFSTSASRSNLLSIRKDLSCQYVDFSGKLLTAIE